MEAPQKDTEILAEDFSYIGGFNNRKENEFSSYTKASNALNLKIMSINETVEKSERVIIEQPIEKAEWETSITESMRSEIDRFKQITSNVAVILKENKSVPSEHTLPEAPAKNPTDKQVNSPFTDTAVANGDKDFKKEQTNHEKAGGPFNEKAEYNGTSDKTPGNGADDGTYCEKTKYVDTGVAGQHPKGGKVARVTEGKDGKVRLVLTEEQVLAWNDNKNYMDKSHGTEIGSSAPFTDELGEESNQGEAPTENIHEAEGKSVSYTDNQNSPTPGTSEVGDTAPYDKKVNEAEVPAEAAAGLPEVEDDFSDYPFPDQARKDAGLEDLDDLEEPNLLDVDDIDLTPMDQEEDEYEIVPDEDDVELDNSRYSDKGMKGLDNWEKDWNKFDDDDDFGGGYDIFDSVQRGREKVFEVKLDDFGKHPAYQKVPMTLPPNKEVAINGAREWDDESAQGEQPYGKQIGDKDPYTETVDKITESLMKKLFSSKKKV